MSKFYSLFSSSKGNASFIGSPAGGMLVDAGATCRKLVQSLKAHGLSAEAVQGICITHTHTDHIKGLRVFLNQHPVPVYGTAETLAQLRVRTNFPRTPTSGDSSTETIHTDSVAVTAFPTMHDAPGSCGYRFELPDGQTCAVCTDLGCVTPEVEKGVLGADLVLLEANYDPNMLRNGPYPEMLQERIRGKYGHLSNGDSAGMAEALIAHGTTRLILGHLSENNNTMPLAQQTVLEHLQEQGMRRNQDFLLQVSSPEGLKQAVIF
ncbi:MAG: MBL fold metallo-hydrolase [Ruminococcus callidus]